MHFFYHQFTHFFLFSFLLKNLSPPFPFTLHILYPLCLCYYLLPEEGTTHRASPRSLAKTARSPASPKQKATK
jgi:hypothetical protein